MAKDVFISHASEDKEAAQAVCFMLEKAGFSCWIAFRDITKGAPYGAEIIEALNNCKTLLVILSAYSNKSPQVRTEVERAHSKDLGISVLRIEEVNPSQDLEYHVSNTQWIDAFPQRIEDYFFEILQAVKTLVGAEKSTLLQRLRLWAYRVLRKLKGVLVSVVTVVVLVILLHTVSGLLDPLPTPELVQRPAGKPWLFTDSDKRELTDDEVCVLCRVELFWARNELYARHGYKFSSENGKAYAAGLGPQYEGTELIDTKVFDGFNEAEKANVFKIRRYEEIRNSFMPILNPENAGFFWHQLKRRLSPPK